MACRICGNDGKETWTADDIDWAGAALFTNDIITLLEKPESIPR